VLPATQSDTTIAKQPQKSDCTRHTTRSLIMTMAAARANFAPGEVAPTEYCRGERSDAVNPWESNSAPIR